MMKSAAVFFCAAVAVACTKSSISYEAPDQEITVRPVTRVSLTKAALDEQKVPADWKLKIFAYYDQTLTAVPSTGLQAGNYSNPYFGGTGVDFAAENPNSTDTYWAGDGKTYYWPRTGSILFSGYAPADFSNGTISYSLSTNSFTLAGAGYTQPDLDKTVDLLYAPYSSAASCESHQVVPMEFKHALAWVEFTVSTDAASETDKAFKVTGLKVEKMASKAITATLSSAGAEWQGQDYADFTFYTNVEGKEVTGTAVEIADVQHAGLVIPAELNDNMVLVIDYKMKKDASTYIDQTFRIKLNSLGSPAIDKWESGKHYIYDISFGGLQPIKVNPSVTEWEPAVNTSIPVSGESSSVTPPAGTGE